ncbi:MAG TPA: PAAR domain-containing protein [Polyangiaceae bacterium]
MTTAREHVDAGFEALKGEVLAVVGPLKEAVRVAKKDDPASPRPPASAARKVEEVAGAVGAVAGLPLQLLNTGFALVTEPLSQVFPALPAATMGTLYVGVPHAHAHPPSLVPPSPPVPLPSLGPVLLGTCVRVLIGGLPAARAGDIGMAPTCGGFVPAFEIKTGSSNVFIGGMRAARLLDLCAACTPGGGAMDAFGAAMMAVGTIAGAAGVVADAEDAQASAAEGNAAMAGAQALAATMSAAQMAADAAATALRTAMGKDPGLPPGTGVLTAPGTPTVLIGGFPMPNLPDPLHLLFEKLKAKGGGRHEEEESEPERENEEESEAGGPTCEGG